MRVLLSVLLCAFTFGLNVTAVFASEYRHWPAIQAALSVTDQKQDQHSKKPSSLDRILTKTDQDLTRCLEHTTKSKYLFDEPLKGLSIFGHEFNCHRTIYVEREEQDSTFVKVAYYRREQFSHAKRLSSDEQIRTRLIVHNPEDRSGRCRYGLSIKIDYTEDLKISESERKAIVMSQQYLRETMHAAYQKSKREGKEWTWRDSARWIIIASASRYVNTNCSYGL